MRRTTRRKSTLWGLLAKLVLVLALKVYTTNATIATCFSEDTFLRSHLPSHPLYSEGSLNQPSSWDGEDDVVLSTSLDLPLLKQKRDPSSRPRGRVPTRIEDQSMERRGSSSVWSYRSESVEKKRALLHFQRQAFARGWESGDLNRSALPIQPFYGYPRRGDHSFMHVTPSSVDEPERVLKLRGVEECEEDLDWIMRDVNEGLLVGERITKMAESAGGAYVMRNANGELHSIFKPLDEEVGAKHHIKESKAERKRRIERKGFVKSSRRGIRCGDAGYRERAVYLLDRGGSGVNQSSFAGVPPVALVTCSGDFRCELFRPDSNVVMDCIEESTSLLWDNNPEALLHALPLNFSCGWAFVNDTWECRNIETGQKVGAMIKFVQHVYTMRDWSPELIPTDQVHRMALLDIRIMNLDRHAGNILVQFYQAEASQQSKSDEHKSGNTGMKVPQSHPGANATVCIVPVNNGYCLPESISLRVQEVPNDVKYAWEEWPQAKEKMSKETLSYIRSLDSEKDAEMLGADRGLKIKPAAITVLKVGTVLLKQCADAGMTFYDIASLMHAVRGNATVLRSGNSSYAIWGRESGESTLNALISRWRREQEELLGRPMNMGMTPCLRSPSGHLYEMVSTLLQDLEGFQLDDDDEDAADPQHDFSSSQRHSAGARGMGSENIKDSQNTQSSNSPDDASTTFGSRESVNLFI